MTFTLFLSLAFAHLVAVISQDQTFSISLKVHSRGVSLIVFFSNWNWVWCIFAVPV